MCAVIWWGHQIQSSIWYNSTSQHCNNFNSAAFSRSWTRDNEDAINNNNIVARRDAMAAVPSPLRTGNSISLAQACCLTSHLAALWHIAPTLSFDCHWHGNCFYLFLELGGGGGQHLQQLARRGPAHGTASLFVVEVWHSPAVLSAFRSATRHYTTSIQHITQHVDCGECIPVTAALKHIK